MNSLLLYLLEASVLLIVLYGLYLLLLRKETYFNFNRFFLLAILVLSLLFPLVSFDIFNEENTLINQQVTQLSQVRNAYHTTFESWSDQQQISQSAEEIAWFRQYWPQHWNGWKVIIALALTIYLTGVVFLILRLLLVYIRIYALKKRLQIEDVGGLKVAKIPSSMAPFSFLNTVFIPDSMNDQSEFDQILAHEKTHVKERHSIDLIFVQLLAAFLWFNPVVWLLIKSLKQTHEYIADKNMLRKGFSLVEYQTLLLRQLISNNSYGLVHNFNLSFIKKRITMMSIKESGWVGKSKAFVTLSLVLFLGMITAQSNTISKESSVELIDLSVETKASMQFFIDGVPLSNGLEYSKLKDTKGVFKFQIENNQEDYIHVGLELIREGRKVASTSIKLKESNSLKVNELLSKAELDDYLIIDIIQGPDDFIKLYNFPLFRESNNWKKNKNNDLPPPPIELFVDGKVVNRDSGVQYSKLKQQGFDAELLYVLSEFVDFNVLDEQGGDVTTTLVRDGKSIKSKVTKDIKLKSTISLTDLLEVAQQGDAVVIQIGDPEGLSIASMFMLE